MKTSDKLIALENEMNNGACSCNQGQLLKRIPTKCMYCSLHDELMHKLSPNMTDENIEDLYDFYIAD